MDKIEKEQEEMKNLNKDLELKEGIFNLIKTGKKEDKEKALKILKENSKIKSYFSKFHYLHQTGKECYLLPKEGPGLQILYNDYFEDIILEDLNKLRREISERGYLLQQKQFLEKQGEFLEIQKQDIEENKKDREKINNFTFILAFGVLVTIAFNMFEIYSAFKNSSSLSLLINSGIFMLVFTLFLLFIKDILDMEEKLWTFWKKSKLWIIILSIAILILVLLLVFIPDRSLNEPKAELILLNQTDHNIQNTNILLNQSLNNQDSINYKLDIVILNQLNKTS